MGCGASVERFMGADRSARGLYEVIGGLGTG